MVWPVSKTKIIQGCCQRCLLQRQRLNSKCAPGKLCQCKIFNLYCLPIQEVIPEDLQLSGFADDHSVRKTFKASNRLDEENTKIRLQECLISIKKWMDETRFKMNPSKTEFIYFSNTKQLQKCTSNSINVAGDLIVRSEVIRYLGVWLNSTLNFKTHITNKCKAAILNFLRIRSIHHLLTEDITSSLVLSLCVSHLDYCNSVLYGLPDVTISKMQKIQNMCAHLVLRKHKWDSITACLETLHWLPVKQCITFKICVLTYI